MHKRTVIDSLNTNNLNTLTEPKVIQRHPFEHAERAEAAPTSTEEPVKTDNTDTITTSNEESGSADTEKDAATRRAERRSAMKRAADIEARARQMEQAAKVKLSQAQHWEQISQRFQQDPTSVAEAFGLSKEEFLQKYHNAIFAIKEDGAEKKEETPEDEVHKRLQSLEQERAARSQYEAQMQYELTKVNYINSKMMPELGNKDKYKFLHKNGIEDSSNYLYELMNTHYTQTGEELSVSEVAEVAEAKLREAFEEKIKTLKEAGLLDEYIPKSEPAQLGNKPSKTLSDSWSSNSSHVQKQRGAYLSREERLAKTIRNLENLDK